MAREQHCHQLQVESVPGGDDGSPILESDSTCANITVSIDLQQHVVSLERACVW
jgi:hypothetical protein